MSSARDRQNLAALVGLLGRKPPPPEQAQPLRLAAPAAGGGFPRSFDLGDGSTLEFVEDARSDGSVGWVVNRTAVSVDGGTTTTTTSRSWSDPRDGYVVRDTTTRVSSSGTVVVKQETWTDGDGTHVAWRKDDTPAGGATSSSTSSMTVGIDPETGEPRVQMTGTDGHTISITPSGMSIDGGQPMSPITVQACVNGTTRTLHLMGWVE